MNSKTQLKRFGADVPLTKQEIEALYPIIRKADPFSDAMSIELMATKYMTCEGWLIKEDKKIIGAISMTNFRPLHSAAIHVAIDPSYHGKWVNRNILREIGTYVFVDLDLVKLYSIAVPGITEGAAKMLTGLNFKPIGFDESGGILPDGSMCDIINFALKREDCKWWIRQ